MLGVMAAAATDRLPILNPRAVPVVGRDLHLPAVDAGRLDAHALRRRFASPPTWEPETRGDGRLLEGRDRSAAASEPACGSDRQ